MRRIVPLVAVLAALVPVPASAQTPPLAVVAIIDTGINPYHEQFRDDSPLAYQHPSTYIPGYPADAQALNLTLDAPTYEAALEADAHIWDIPGGVFDRKLYWIPGTRIIGAYRVGSGGVSCPTVHVPPVSRNALCPERPILDDVGHGTMTASRAASRDGSTAPGARIVAIEGLGAQGVRWAAAQPWIDVQTNSWLSFVPGPGETGNSLADAARTQLVFAASGNGTGYTNGFAPHPTYLLSTGAPGVLLVGAHDNGRVSAWSGAPPHVLTDGYGGPVASHRSLDAFGPDPGACCTSAASPYAAGVAAGILLQARTILGDTTPGMADGVAASGPAGLVGDGPLADGELTLDELRTLVLRTAEARPAEGAHDGLLHWTGDPRPPELLPYGPGANPYCQGCWTAPVRWTELPDDAPAYPLAGYGALNERSAALAASVLRGETALPSRPDEDAFFAADQTVRGVLFLN